MSLFLISVDESTYKTFSGDKIKTDSVDFGTAKEILEENNINWAVGEDCIISLARFEIHSPRFYSLSPVFRRRVLEELEENKWRIYTEIDYLIDKAYDTVSKRWGVCPKFDIPITVNLPLFIQKAEDAAKEGRLPNLNTLAFTKKELSLLKILMEGCQE